MYFVVVIRFVVETQRLLYVIIFTRVFNDYKCVLISGNASWTSCRLSQEATLIPAKERLFGSSEKVSVFSSESFFIILIDILSNVEEY